MQITSAGPKVTTLQNDQQETQYEHKKKPYKKIENNQTQNGFLKMQNNHRQKMTIKRYKTTRDTK